MLSLKYIHLTIQVSTLEVQQRTSAVPKGNLSCAYEVNIVVLLASHILTGNCAAKQISKHRPFLKTTPNDISYGSVNKLMSLCIVLCSNIFILQRDENNLSAVAVVKYSFTIYS